MRSITSKCRNEANAYYSDKSISSKVELIAKNLQIAAK